MVEGRSNFSFSHNVFHSYVSLVHQNAVLCGNVLSLPDASDEMPCEKIVLVTSIFSFSHHVFYLLEINLLIIKLHI